MSQVYSAEGTRPTTTNALKNGVIAGLGGGLVFGIMMGMMGMLPMVGMLIGQDSAIVGFIVHMLISAFFGGVYGLIAARFFSGLVPNLVAGAIYGIGVWVIGALIMMPLLLGMNEMVLQIGQAQWMSLLGHIIYGAITGAIFASLSR